MYGREGVMLDDKENKLKWETPQLQCLDTKQNTGKDFAAVETPVDLGPS